MLSLLLFLSFVPVSAAIRAGSGCSKEGITSVFASTTYRCIKSGKKLVWAKDASGATPVPLIPTEQIAIRIENMLHTSTGISGVYLKQIDGAVISEIRSDYLFEPASSIKVLVALYIFSAAVRGEIKLSDSFPTIKSLDPEECPKPITNSTESFESATREMMQFSDNGRTDALVMFFGPQKINDYAKSIGLPNTQIQTTSSFPGFNLIGCVASKNINDNPITVDGNTSNLQELGKVWELANALPDPFRAQFMRLTAGREMFETTGKDFTGIWPSLINIVKQEAPSGMSPNMISNFISQMRSNSKGGSYSRCFKTPNCTTVRSWRSMVSLSSIPYCLSKNSASSRSFVWGYFSAGVDSNSAEKNSKNISWATFSKLDAEPVREQIRIALLNWSACGT